MPTLLGMPLLLAQYGNLTSMCFSSILINYPRGYPILDISDISNILLKDATALDSAKLNAWIDLMVGPLPADKMPERVAAIIEEMIAG